MQDYLREGRLAALMEYLWERAVGVSDVPAKALSILPSAEFKLCLNRAIKELCDARGEL